MRTDAEWMEILSKYGIPDHMHYALILYIDKRIKPGSFLLAVLSNDLADAVGRADDTNIYCLRNYVRFLKWEVPYNSWGSPTAVQDWLNGNDDDSAK